MLSNFISDKYHGGNDNSIEDEYSGGAMSGALSLFGGALLGLVIIIIFLYLSRHMTSCSSSFISHLDNRSFEDYHIQNNEMREQHNMRGPRGLTY